MIVCEIIYKSYVNPLGLAFGEEDDGLEKLTFDQQVEILNAEENFVGISEAANKSKGPKSYEEWEYYKPRTPEEVRVDDGFRKKMIEKEKKLEIILQEKINTMLKGGSC